MPTASEQIGPAIEDTKRSFGFLAFATSHWELLI
jgi:hypothetical protein